VIRAERTFWEKATILHHEAHRPDGSPQPLRYSRHYYDLARMCAAPVRKSALEEIELLRQVVEFKRRFYPRGWARYEEAWGGNLRLVPTDHVLDSVARDYDRMAEMIFGEVPTLDALLQALGELESEVNSRE